MFYGWTIVGGVFIAQLFVTGFMTYAFGLMVVPIQTDFGASRAELMYGLTASTIIGLFLSPVIGAMVDKRSIRVLMSIGALIFGAGLYLLSLTENILQFAVVFGIAMAFANLLLGPLTGSPTISRWFSTSRGKALGISAIGTSVGGIVIPALVTHWLETGGWRVCMQNLGSMVLLIVLPYLVIWMRGKPSDKNLTIEGGVEPPQNDHAAASDELSTGGVLSHRSFWVIGITMGLLFSTYAAMVANLPAYATDLGAEGGQASRLIMLIAICGLIGKLVFGVAADKISHKLGLFIAIALVMGGMIILAIEPSYPLMMLAAVLLGFAAGGMLPVWGAMMASVFGVTSYGRVMGLMTPVITLFVMPGYQIAGAIYDHTGSYANCFYLFIALLLLAAICLSCLSMPPANNENDHLMTAA